LQSREAGYIVCVQRSCILPSALVKSNVPGIRRTTIARILNQPDASVLVGSNNVDGSISGCIIYDKELEIGVRLTQDALYGLPQEPLPIVDRHHNGDLGHRRRINHCGFLRYPFLSSLGGKSSRIALYASRCTLAEVGSVKGFKVAGLSP